MDCSYHTNLSLIYLKYPYLIRKYNMSSNWKARWCRKVAPDGVNVTVDHMELVKSLWKSVLACNLPHNKIPSEVPSICLGRYVDKIISSLLAYASVLGCLFMGRINVAYNLQLVFIWLMTGSHKMPCIEIWKVMALIKYTDAQIQIWKRKPNK